MRSDWHWPAEWTPQDAVLLAWPTPDGDWANVLEPVRCCYRQLIDALRQTTPVILALPPGQASQPLAESFADASHPLALIHLPHDDTWLRDSGPITLLRDADTRWLDFRFRSWGGFDAAQDVGLVQHLRRHKPLRRVSVETIDWSLEGGAIDSDGAGTVLTTVSALQHCMPNRSRTQIEERLRQALHCDRVLWIEHGGLIGDETEAHIDTLARFANEQTIVFQGCQDETDAQFGVLQQMREQLTALRTVANQPYRLHELPCPQPIHADDGRRLPASYANFLISNGQVLMPSYDQESDQQALLVLQEAFPKHTITPVDCRPLLINGGSLHCLTMQLPAGTVDWTQQGA